MGDVVSVFSGVVEEFFVAEKDYLRILHDDELIWTLREPGELDDSLSSGEGVFSDDLDFGYLLLEESVVLLLVVFIFFELIKILVLEVTQIDKVDGVFLVDND